MGICGACGKLTFIRGVGQRFGERTVNWYPVSHRAFRHSCGALVGLDEDGTATCPRCGTLPDLTTLAVVDPCPGVKQAL